MIKHSTILLIAGCLASTYCAAQPLPAQTAAVPRAAKKLVVPVTFIADDTCTLRINGDDYGEIDGKGSKTVKLALGNYRLFFESLETGETIKKRLLELTKDSLIDGKYTYRVTFKPGN